MYYIIEESKKNNIQNYKGNIRISVTDFSYLDDPKKLITEALIEDKLLTMIKFPDTIISLIVTIIIENKDMDYLKEKLTELNLPLYSLIISIVNSYKEKYKRLLEFKNAFYILIMATPNNLTNVVDLAIKLEKKVIIDGKSIPFVDYKKILSNYDLETLSKIEIDYQKYNNISTLKEIYLASAIIDTMTKNIQKYNLSPLEKVIYAYDIVKSKESKSIESNQNASNSASMALHINSGYYSNIFNAMLLSLGINAIPLINNTQNYRRSFVYIKDSKYNIDGVYAFDPYCDRKVGGKYINNYKHFALTPSKSQKEVKADNASKINISFEELLSHYEMQNTNFINDIDTLNELEMLFNLIEENSFEYFNELAGIYQFARVEEQEEVKNMHKNFIEKYNPKEIPITTLLEALYSARLIEYYNGIIDKVAIENIKEAVKVRDIFQKFNYEEVNNDANILELIKYSKLLNTILKETISEKEEELVRKDLNIRLLKVLKKK